MRSVACLTVALLMGGTMFSAPARAADEPSGVAGHFQIRLRGLGVLPDPKADIKVGGTSIGGVTDITDSFVPEVDGTYFVTDNIGVELIAATTKHAVHNSVAGNVGTVWLLPPTVTLQYHFDPNGAVRPYVGAGINYTFFYTPHSVFAPIHYSDNFGWALQAGVDVPVGDGPYFLNFDVKKLFLSTHIKAAGGAVQASADINPWIVGAGIGIRL